MLRILATAKTAGLLRTACSNRKRKSRGDGGSSCRWEEVFAGKESLAGVEKGLVVIENGFCGALFSNASSLGEGVKGRKIPGAKKGNSWNFCGARVTPEIEGS